MPSPTGKPAVGYHVEKHRIDQQVEDHDVEEGARLFISVALDNRESIDKHRPHAKEGHIVEKRSKEDCLGYVRLPELEIAKQTCELILRGN